MKFKETQVNQGGLMRCCLQSLGLSHEEDDEVQDLETVQCQYGHEVKMVLQDGVWRWWSEAEGVDPLPGVTKVELQ